MPTKLKIENWKLFLITCLFIINRQSVKNTHFYKKIHFPRTMNEFFAQNQDLKVFWIADYKSEVQILKLIFQDGGFKMANHRIYIKLAKGGC